jgi:predicted nucleic acid-binding protein
VIIDAAPLDEPVSDDPADDMFLAAALASKARIVVSGEKDLLRVSGWRGIVVLTPRQLHNHYFSAR